MRTLFILFFITLAISTQAGESIVDKHGQLHVDGNYIMDEHNQPVQLRGMSFFWSQWQGKYYTPGTVKWLKKDWGCNVVRPAMGVEKGGYLTQPKEEQAKVEVVIKAAIKNGIYVIVDYHAHEAHENTQAAKTFFADIAQKYGDKANIIYEIYNEPLGGASHWSENIKPYAQQVIDTIRHYDPDNIIIVGTPQWSQLVDAAAADPIEKPNIAYTLHFYATTHKQELRDIAQVALDKGLCLVVTEFGTCPASGDGKLDLEETLRWFEFLDKNKISWCNWSIADKDESASAVKPNANEWGGWEMDMLTESGKFIRNQIRKGNGVE